MDGGIGQAVLVIVIMVAVLLGAYYVTKFLAKRGKRLSNSKFIKIVDQVFLSTDKQLALIKVGGKSILVGITSNSINLITELDEKTDEIINEQIANADQQKDFSAVFVDFIKKAKNSPDDLRNARRDAKSNKKDNTETAAGDDKNNADGF